MTEGGQVSDIGLIEAPYRREVLLQDVVHDSGMRMLRIRIREGRRFTILDIDAPTAEAWTDIMTKWVRGELPADGSAEPASSA